MTLPCEQFPYTKRRIYLTEVGGGSMGPYVRRKKFSDVIRHWLITYPVLTNTQKEAVISEFNSAKGLAGTFSHQPVEDVSTTTVQFVQGSLRADLVSGRQWSVSFAIEEVLLGTST